MHFVDFVLRNLLRRRMRTALTVVGVSVAIAAVVALLSITGGFERSSKDVYESHGVDMIVVQAGKSERETSTLDENLASRLQKLDGVNKVTMLLWEDVSFESLEGARHLNGWPPDSFAFDTLTILPGGKSLEPNDSHAVLLGTALAGELQKKVGDEVEIESSKFKVIGIYESGSMVDNNAAVVSLADLQALMQRKGQVSEFDIAMRKDIADRNAAMLKLRDEIENLKTDEGKKLGLAAQATEDFVKSGNQIRLGPCHGLGNLRHCADCRLDWHAEHHDCVGAGTHAGNWHFTSDWLAEIANYENDSRGIVHVKLHRGDFRHSVGLRADPGAGRLSDRPGFCARRYHHAGGRDGVSAVCFVGTGWRRLPGTARRQFAPYRGFAL